MFDAVEVGAHQQARSGGGREGRGERELWIVAPAEALVALRPGEVEDELAERVCLDEGRGGRGQPAAIMQRQIARLPAQFSPDLGVPGIERGRIAFAAR